MMDPIIIPKEEKNNMKFLFNPASNICNENAITGFIQAFRHVYLC
jgi:hypothetical protein